MDVVRNRSQLKWIGSTFNLVEINSSFYRIPSIQSVRRWIKVVSDNPDFVFNLKMLSVFTHKRELKDEDLRSFIRVLKELRNAGHLGCVLLQFPWSFKPLREEKIYLHRLVQFFKSFPLAIEVRHIGWITDNYLQYLKKKI